MAHIKRFALDVPLELLAILLVPTIAMFAIFQRCGRPSQLLAIARPTLDGDILITIAVMSVEVVWITTVIGGKRAPGLALISYAHLHVHILPHSSIDQLFELQSP